jgi:hypothetical protein
MTRARTKEEMIAFLDKKSRSTPSGCHLWLGGLDKDGYGQTWFEGANIRTHRLVWFFNFGAIPEGLVVMHSCDTPACINPAHLNLGTNIENNLDKLNKGRHRVASGDSHYYKRRPELIRHGENTTQAKLTEEKVIQILRKLKSGEPQKQIAKEFLISRTAVSAIATRRNWKHVSA